MVEFPASMISIVELMISFVNDILQVAFDRNDSDKMLFEAEF